MNRTAYLVLVLLVFVASFASPLFEKEPVVAQPQLAPPVVGETKIVVTVPTSAYVPGGDPKADLDQDMNGRALLGEEFQDTTLDVIDTYQLMPGELFAYITIKGDLVNLGVFTSPDLAHFLASKEGYQVIFFIATGGELKVIEALRQWCLSEVRTCVY